MLEYEVNNREELVAAIKAAAQPSFAEARNNPVKITLGKTRYALPNGVQEDRAAQITRNIMRTSASAFKVAC